MSLDLNLDDGKCMCEYRKCTGCFHLTCGYISNEELNVGNQANLAFGTTEKCKAYRNAGEKDLKPCHCLIVEDNVVLHRILSKWFESLKVQCTHCFDGKQAVEKCREQKYSLIFMDVAMPGMNGIEAARVIRAEGANRTTPIIAFSALDGTPNLFEVGFNAYLKKPFTKMDLFSMISEWADQEVTSVMQTSRFSVPKEEHTTSMFEAYDDLSGIFDTMQDVAVDFNGGVIEKDGQFVGAEGGGGQGSIPKLACLVVEDNPVTQRFITAYLEKLRMGVTQAFDGNEAVKECQRRKFDVIFMDISMPVMNGIQATKCIRQAESLNQFTPVIAFSSYGSKTEYAMHGLDDFLPKPFTKNDLTNMVEKWSPFPPSGVVDSTTLSSMLKEQEMMQEPFSSLGAPNSAGNASGVIPDTSSLLASGVNLKGLENRLMMKSDGSDTGVSVGEAGSPSVLSQSGPKVEQTDIGGNVWKGGSSSKKSKKMEGIDLGDFVPKSAKEEVSRMNHNAKERNRRKDISDCIDCFREMIPDCSEKTDKATVLKLAVEYMQELFRQNRKLKAAVTTAGLTVEDDEKGKEGNSSQT